MARRHNPYRPGSASYERLRRAALNRRRALAEAKAARAKNQEMRRRAKRQAQTAGRGLRQIDMRREFRDSLSDLDRASFDRLPVVQQQRLMTVARAYPERISAGIPDPFADQHLYQRRFYRGSLWRLYYGTRAGIRRKTTA